MGRTRDRTPGPSEEERTDYDVNTGVSTTGEGQVLYSDDRFKMRDALGEFDPRAGTGITEAQHRALRTLIHFIDDGPAEGFASGAFKETLPSASVFPTSVIWWESSGKTKKIVERALTWTGVNLTTSVWKIYDTDGSTVLATITDAISYSGIFETTRTRTIA
jgi:hypothetical protein